MKKHINKALVFVINLLLMAVAFLLIKNQDQKKIASNQDVFSDVVPVADSILNAQKNISTSRENALLELNNTPIETKTTQTTTTTTTKTTPKASTSTSKTKTS